MNIRMVNINEPDHLTLYATPKDFHKKRRFFFGNTLTKKQKIEDNNYLTKQLFHAVQHHYHDFLEIVPKHMWKTCLNIQEDKHGFTLLHYAVVENHEDIVTFLLKMKPNINIPGYGNIYPIHLAAQKGHTEIINLLCKEKSLMIDALDNKGQTALHVACRRGHHEVVKALLKFGASITKVESDKISVIHHPARRNDIAMIETLVQYKAPLTLRNNNGQTPLMIAAIEGYPLLFEYFLKTFKEKEMNISEILNEKDNDGHSCLSFAVQNQNSNIIKLCLNNGADINAKQADGKTIFHTAAITGFSPLFDMIEKTKISIDEPDMDLNTPLHQAILNNSPKIVDLIIKHKANINICNRLFQTPIILACSETCPAKNLTEIIKILIAAKVNLTIRDQNMKTVFHYLVEKENLEMIQYIVTNISPDTGKDLCNYQDDCYNTPLHIAAKLGNIEICQFLLNTGANPILFAKHDELPVHIATIHGHLDVVKLLLNLHPETANYRDTRESCVILLAAKKGKTEIFKYLTEIGHDCLEKDEFGANTLMFASRSGCLSVVEYLLNKEINVNLHDQLKYTALHYAAEEGHLDVVEALWKYGALLTDNIYGQTALDIALINKKEEVAKFFLNDKNWQQVMAYRHQKGDSHIENLIRYNDELTLELMDRCVKENVSNKLDPNYEVRYSFGILDAGPDDSASIKSRYYALLSMAKYGKLNLLHSPLAYELFLEKWYKYGLLFYLIDFVLFIIYLIGITVYVSTNDPMLDGDQFDPVSGCKISMPNDTSSKTRVGNHIVAHISIVYVISIIRNVWRCMNLFAQRYRFFLDVWNYFFITCDVLLYILSTDPMNIFCIYQWQICPALLFLSYFLLLYYLRFVPVLGIQVMMFLRVLVTIIKVIVSFACLLVGFSYGFYIMNSDQIPFQNPGLAMIKSTSMMIGEMELVAYFIGAKNNYFYSSIIMAALFLIIMPITLFNLIVGLAVGDINEMALEAKLSIMRMKIMFAWESECNLFIRVQRYFYNSEIVKRSKTINRDSNG